MLTVLAHAGQPVEPHDLWRAWNLDPLLVGGLIVALALYRRGRTDRRWRQGVDVRREVAFMFALAAIVVALVTPLDALAASLASAHMVQHVLLILVAAPLLAISSPWTTMYRGTPAPLRRLSARARRRVPLSPANLRQLSRPSVAWLAHVAAIWLWHSTALYSAALTNEALHIAEHLIFLGTATLFWWVVVRPRTADSAAQGLAVLLVFGMVLQSVFLSVLLTFAEAPWYPAYAATTRTWGLEPLADQQLAGVIMWVPAGALYVGVGLTLFALWLRSTDGSTRV